MSSMSGLLWSKGRTGGACHTSSPPRAVSEGDALASPDTGTDYRFFENRAALVFSGGGARAAYQVGVLQAIADWLPPDAPCPFSVLVGTSAGAINAAALAARGRRFAEAVAELERVWSGFHLDQVVRTDAGDRAAGRPALGGVAAVRRLAALAAALAARHLAAARSARRRRFRSTASRPASPPVRCRPSPSRPPATPPGRRSRSSRPRPTTREWRRVRRAGVRRTIDLDVLMASSAIPFIFPAARSRRRLLRRRRHAPARAAQSRPCTSAPIACWSSARAPMPRRDARRTAASDSPPSPGHLLGFVLDSLFTDGLSIDVERLRQINELISADGDRARTRAAGRSRCW